PEVDGRRVSLRGATENGFSKSNSAKHIRSDSAGNRKDCKHEKSLWLDFARWCHVSLHFWCGLRFLFLFARARAAAAANPACRRGSSSSDEPGWSMALLGRSIRQEGFRDKIRYPIPKLTKPTPKRSVTLKSLVVINNGNWCGE